MSLIRPVIRMCTRQALLNKTWAEDRVYDSDNTPLINALETVSKPYITVYTDEDNRIDVEGRDIFASTRNLSLTIEIGVASAVQTTQGGTQIQIPSTDEGMEFTIDVLEGQVMNELFGSPYNEWSEIIKSIVLRIVRVPSQRGSSSERGTRWAARQIVFVCDVIADMPLGVVPDESHPLIVFSEKAKATASPSLVAAGNLISALVNKSEYPEWRQVQAWLGLSKQEVRAMGIAPVLETDEVAATLKDIVVQDVVFLEAISVEVSSPEIGAPPIEIQQ